MVKVVNYKKWKAGGENIMRPGVLGNPFDSRQLGITREESIAKFKEWMYDQINTKKGIYDDLCRLANFSKEGDTVILICACKPLNCHGDIIKEWIDNINKTR